MNAQEFHFAFLAHAFERAPAVFRDLLEMPTAGREDR